jgi:hypothetical protein
MHRGADNHSHNASRIHAWRVTNKAPLASLARSVSNDIFCQGTLKYFARVACSRCLLTLRGFFFSFSLNFSIMILGQLFFDLASENCELLAKSDECLEKLIHTPVNVYFL